MCGITGIISRKTAHVDQEELKTMMAAMKHRGPDDEGLFVEKNLGLGFVRLSIIDLSTAGHQPMFTPDERYVLIFNGEIFNYIELRKELIAKGHSFRSKTDSEVLLRAYIEWGEDMLPRLNGMWAFAIYDREEKTFFASRDRYGIKPFYYCIEEERILFGSELPCILEVLKRKPTADDTAVFDFLTFNRTDQSDGTFFREIKKLNHGHYVKLRLVPEELESANPFRPRRWYDLKKELKSPFRNAHEFGEMFSSSIGLRLRSDVPVGVCLSGGLDSSSIVSVLLKDFDKRDLNTFSAVYGSGKYGDESKFINLYKTDLQNMFFTIPDEHTLMADIEPFVKAHAEPIPNTGPYAQYKVMELAKEHVTVTLDGQGADEELAGYHYFFGFYFKNLLLKGRAGRLLPELIHYYRNHSSTYGLKSFLFLLLPKNMRTRLRAMDKGYLHPDFYELNSRNTSVAGELYSANTLQEALINHFEYKLEHLLKWEDRNSMFFSLEARVPFLDYRLVERTLSLPEDLIINKGMTKHVLREAMKGILPNAIRMRRDKIGFGTPQDEWYRTEIFQKYIWDLIRSDSFASRNVIDAPKTHEMYRKHLEKKGNYAKEIWKWIHLENWYRQFID